MHDMFFSSKEANQMITKLIPVFSADAAHCASSTRGTLFSLYGMDSNKRQIMIAFMLISDNECEKTWKMFFEFVSASISSA